MSKDQVISNPPMVEFQLVGTPRLLLDGLGRPPGMGEGGPQGKTQTKRGHPDHCAVRACPAAAPPGPAFREARREFSSCSDVTVIAAPVDDIWMRDIAPTFGFRSKRGCAGSYRDRLELQRLGWHARAATAGWRPARQGGCHDLRRAASVGVFVAEGGALATDGRGTMITTRSCLLNPNRNPVRRGEARQQMIETEIGQARRPPSDLARRRLVRTAYERAHRRVCAVRAGRRGASGSL